MTKPYLTRLVVRPEIAEELVQGAVVRALESDRTPASGAELRPWLFRIATNLALDQLRSERRWRNSALLDARVAAESDPAFVEASAALRGTPEHAAIAREHLLICFACVMRNLAPDASANPGFALIDLTDLLAQSSSRSGIGADERDAR